tara:strand:- start:186 stop:797 length:612 start_codon:yes stop_codon:yes gene_type:complete
MLGLGLKRKGIFSGPEPVIPVESGFFSVAFTMPGSATKVNLQASDVYHKDDSDVDDSSPGILIKDIKFYRNGNLLNYTFDSNNISTSSSVVGTVAVTSDSLSFGDTTYNLLGQNFPYSDQNLYTDNNPGSDILSLSNSDELKIEGVITLNDGSGNLYTPHYSMAEDARIKFGFAGTNAYAATVFIWTGYDTSGETGNFTKIQG